MVDSNHIIEYLKYVATQKLLDRKGGERSVDQHLSAVSANPTPVMLPLLRRLPNPHFSFLALFPPYHPILTMDHLMVPPFPDSLITV